MIQIIFAFLISIASIHAGQSLSGGLVGNPSFPTRSKALPYRVEVDFSNWPDNGAFARLIRIDALGLDCFQNGMTLGCNFPWAVGSPGFLYLLPSTDRHLSIRFQYDPDRTLGPSPAVYLEIWNRAGKLLFQQNVTWSALNSAYVTNGIDFTGSSQVSYVRIHSTLVALNSRPPVTRDDSNRIAEWKLDGNLTENVTGTYNLSGTASYVQTPNQIVTAKINTVGAPSWSDWVSMRAGYPATLSCARSYSQNDLSPDVSCEWTQVKGPSTLRWSSRTESEPVITGIVFGSYTIRLVARSVDGLITGSQELTIGAVAMDDNGVVIHDDPNVEKLFGPMIAFGKNPWALADESHMRGSRLRSATYDKYSPPEWTNFRPGTVSYATPDVGLTTLAAPVQSTAMSISVTNASLLDLTKFPTIIGLGTPGYGGEEVLICGSSGNTLNVCFDGRGYGSGGTTGAYSTGLGVYQRKASGIGTAFLSDFCPAGPGLEGTIRYNQGTISVTNGSAVITGLNTVWPSSGIGSLNSQMIRIAGTHGSGTPFVFHATVSVNSATQITLGRVWPGDTASGLTYHIIQREQRNFAPLYDRVGAPVEQSEGYQGLGTTACLSDTELYFNKGQGLVNGSYVNKRYSWVSTNWMTAGGNGTLNFYDEVLANYALYFRSGWEPAREAARKIGDYWLENPGMDAGLAGSFPRNMSITGIVAAAILDGRTQNWYAIRNLAKRAAQSSVNADCDADTRENAYELSWLALAALFDPLDTGNPSEPGQRSYWKAKIEDSYNRDNNCKGANYSFPSGSYFYASGPKLSVTAGSTAVTGSGFSASMCPQQARGSGFINTGSSRLTSTVNIPAGNYMVISGTLQGAPYTRKYNYSGSGTNVNLSIFWAGDPGQVQWMVEPDTYTTTISPQNPLDPDFGRVYGCNYNSSTSLTLDHAWEGSTRNDVYLYRGVLVGRGQQPFLLGIKTLQMKWASLAANGSTAAQYLDLATGAANWIRTTGYDPVTGGLFYGRGMAMCEPDLTESGPNFSYRAMECSYTSSYAGKSGARALLSEAQNAMRLFYEAAPTPANREIADQFYANQWGSSTLTKPGTPLSEGGIGNGYATDASLDAGKWYGFQFGVGMAHQWPAVRLGGAAPPLIEERTVGYTLDNASTARIIAKSPSGKETETPCSVDFCTISIDRRQGTYWYKIRFFNAQDEVTGESDPDLIELP